MLAWHLLNSLQEWQRLEEACVGVFVSLHLGCSGAWEEVGGVPLTKAVEGLVWRDWPDGRDGCCDMLLAGGEAGWGCHQAGRC